MKISKQDVKIMARYGIDMDELINARTLAKMIGVTRQAIHHRCLKNSLPHIKLEGVLFFNKAQIDFALHKVEWRRTKRKNKQRELLK